MAKTRAGNQYSPPFQVDSGDSSVACTKKRFKATKRHPNKQKMISSEMVSKILKEALLQQKEIKEEDEATKSAGISAENSMGLFEEDENHKLETLEEIDSFAGFPQTESQFASNECGEIDKDYEKLWETFFRKDADHRRTLADLIVERINKEEVADISSEMQPLPKLDDSSIDLYKGVGKYLNKYTAGKIPKAFKHMPSMKNWEDILYLTEPEKWSPTAVYQATRIFASNLRGKEAERFYRLVLLPRVRDDIRKNRYLHFALCQSLKKSLYKPDAFYKGILFPLCKSGTCTYKEADIIGGVIKKVKIGPCYSGAALVELTKMEYFNTTSYFIKLLLEKNYSLPQSVINAMVAYFMRFVVDERIMPVMWHQSLLAFVQRYKNGLQKEDKDDLRILLEKQKHKFITPEIIRELDNSRNKVQEEELLPMVSSLSLINKPVAEDLLDIPEVPMEED